MNDPDFDPYSPPRAPVGRKSAARSDTAAIDGNPWLTVWTRPRATIRGIVDTDPTRSVALLAMLYGINSTLSNSLQKNAGDAMSLPAIIGLALIGGSIGGILGNMLIGALVRWTGSWIGGVATYEECRAAIAWGSVPGVVNLILTVGLIAVFGNDLFRSSGLEQAGTEKAVGLLVVGLIQVVVGLWAAVITIKCVAEVHRFSAWKGLGTFLLITLIVLGVVMILVVGVVGVSAVLKPQA